MESEKYRSSSSDTSSEENDQIQGEKTVKKRSYECTFCKRGFTNAQALGGHMNIHRKDLAKAKQSYDNYNEEYRYPLVTSESSSPNKYYPIFESQRNYNMCLQFPPAALVSNVSSRNVPYCCFNQQDHHQHSFRLGNQEQLWGANLSLRVESSNGIVKDDELDLELRLGNDR